jgi:hypothetical protein
MYGYLPAQQSLPPAAPAYVPPVPVATNGLAVASLVLGIVWIFWLGSLLALIFGYVAKGQVNESEGTQSGKGLAIAGIALGWVGVGTFCLMMLMAAFGH